MAAAGDTAVEHAILQNDIILSVSEICRGNRCGNRHGGDLRERNIRGNLSVKRDGCAGGFNLEAEITQRKS